MFRKATGIAVLVLAGLTLALPPAAQVKLESSWSLARAERSEFARHGRIVARTSGAYEWVIDASDVFGVEVDNVILFDADKRANGDVSGRIFYRQQFLDNDFLVLIDVTCLEIYDGNRVKIGGIVEAANDPVFDGLFGWFQAIDNGRGIADESTIVGFGDEIENEEFCASPNLPNFGPWMVDGKLKVNERRRGGHHDGDDDDDDDDGYAN